MQISMDILSLVLPKTDSGAPARQRAGPNTDGGSKFEKLLAEALTGPEPLKTGRQQPIKMVAGETDARVEPLKSDENPDATIAAAIMGNQETVVFILEGDKESATAPDAKTDAIPDDPIPADVSEYPIDTGTDASTYHVNANTKTGEYQTDAAISAPDAKPEEKSPEVVDARIEPDTSGGMAAVTGQTELNEGQGAVKKLRDTDSSGSAGNTVNNDIDAGGAEGEVTARMPIIRTSERQGNEGGSSEFSEHGDLSPLENENDKAPVKGQKEKTYSETANAARNKTENAREHASNAPPLAQGIKPEQFRADQEMRQIAHNAPVSTGNLFDEIVSRIDMMQTDTARTMTIQLKPEFLGKVALEIAMDAAGLHVKIDAANSDVRAMISGQINALIESLEHKGIEVADVEVAYTGIDNGAFKESREGDQAQPDRPRKPYRVADITDNAAYYAALPVDTLDYYIDAGLSSVEYRA